MRNCCQSIVLVALSLGLCPITYAGGTTFRAETVTRIDARSGRLVRQVIPVKPATPAGKDAVLRNREAVDQLVEAMSRKHEVDPLLVRSVIAVESNFDPYAVSPKGAQGLMQLVPETARRFGVRNSFDVRQNIEAGVRYLKFLQETFQDDRLALAAYNAGEGAVVKHQWIPPYRETQDYVNRVAEKYKQLKQEAEQGTAKAVPEEAAPEYRAVESFVDSEGKFHLRTR